MLPLSAACERNKDPILNVLRDCLAASGQVLEVGSGTGQHAVYFARALPHLIWQPTEQPEYLADLNKRIELEKPNNLRSAVELDVRQPTWPVGSVNAVFTANTLHIMSWPEVISLFQGVGQVLISHGVLCIYGPFRYSGRYTSDSNEAFDRMLQQRDPESGIRDMDAITALAQQHGLRLYKDHDLPANNRLLVFIKESG